MKFLELRRLKVGESVQAKSLESFLIMVKLLFLLLSSFSLLVGFNQSPVLAQQPQPSFPPDPLPAEIEINGDVAENQVAEFEIVITRPGTALQLSGLMDKK